LLTAEIPDATVIAADPGLHRCGMEGGDDEPEFPVLDGPVFLLGACALVDATWAVVGEDPLSEASARSRRHRTRSWFRARFRSSPSSPGRARTSPVTGGCPPASGPGSGPRSGGWPPAPSRRFAPRTPARPRRRSRCSSTWRARRGAWTTSAPRTRWLQRGPGVRRGRVALETVRDRHGFAVFAERAAPQLIRWESRWGWTRHGDDKVSEKETSLASVLARMLRARGLDRHRRPLPGRA